MARPTEEDFVEFLRSLLKLARLHDDYMAELLDHKNVREFTRAFTHPSKNPDPKKNYQLYEFLGDPVINAFIVFYLRERFPRITSEKWLTKIKHNLIGKKELAKQAAKRGLERFILYGEEINESLRLNRDRLTNIPYLSMLEDVMEAFFGCLVVCVQNTGRSHGVAIEICHRILHAFFDNEVISLEYEDIFDPISRLKEIAESSAIGLRWPADRMYQITNIQGMQENEANSVKVTVYGWPLNDRKFDQNATHRNRVQLAEAFGPDKAETKQRAAKVALDVLKKKYNIEDVKSHPYDA
jgi:dsRNA-specific ribonuclease